MNYWIQFSTKLLVRFERILKDILLFLVAVYRTVGSQHLGGQCRFHPSCSLYAVDCLKTHSVLNSIKLISLRILKCHPFGSSGWDPVPPASKGPTKC